MKTDSVQIHRRTRFVLALLAASVLTPRILAQFTQTGAGPFDYNTSGNWSGGIINGIFSETPTTAQQVTFATNTALTTGLTFSLGGSSTSITLLGNGSNVALTLAGDISVSGTASGITLGAASPNNLSVDLGGTDRTFTVNSGNTLTVQNAISGSNAVTKAGTGTLTYSGTNTYSGTTTVNAGTLSLNANGTLASGSNLVVDSNAASTTALLSLGAGFTQTIGTLTLGGAGGTTTSTNNVTLGAGSTLTLGGTLTFDATGNPLTSTISGGTLALGGSRTMSVADSTTQNADLNISSAITGSGDSLTKTGTGRLQLTGVNTYDGGTILNGGVIFVGATNALLSTGAVTINNLLGATSTMGFNTGAGGNNTIGALTFGGTGASSSSQNDIQINTSTLNLNGTVTYNATGNPHGSTISPLGTGALALGTSRTFDIGNSSSTTTELTISAPVSGGSLTKIGAGTLRLSGANTYTGGTIASAGGLVVTNTTGSGVGTGALAIQSGAFLNGTGFIGGATTIQSGGIMGSGGTGGTAGTLTFTNGLTLNDGAVFNFQLGSTSDKFVITGGILTGATTSGSLTINLTAGPGFAPGNYTLVDFTSAAGTSSLDLADFTLGTQISGFTSSLAFSGSTLQLSASAIPEPSTYAAIVGLAALGFGAWRRRRSVA
jgi:fibronectin-binding autotransporter adhesin